ncbi:aminomethyl-transferring glycine dehydrogenase subunit GcvPB [Candidatus Berkiella aquae]|uniref:Probable glycine dehydrogenase (decarboxylating) subunit 2 n=1 Tax=Candidatus Berkiella aquae TaxID=295108 RepID=A0A0Q9YZ37_9GAMM|nr:aminomethyl-transferring glycine dehydrogenase subunit GcvPB [Candidatus Berkiella aquae]MCS5712561.1 aminomethyl-transferring glycine dehydrogenase subunit GcvPB [Candidatus Berkiella aquae]
MTIFDKSQPGRQASAQFPTLTKTPDLPQKWLRQDIPLLPELSELEVVRHFTRLAQQNYCIDTHFYPLGSCTMKYNPRGVQHAAMLPGFLHHHPLAPLMSSQGFMHCLYELQEYLKAITGMVGISLTPMAGAQGEWAGVAMMRAYHHERQDFTRTEILVPDTAHGTNPASAAMCGFTVREIPTTDDGDIDIVALKAMVGPQTAGIMLTNPSTLGVFERSITTVAKLIHEAGGLLYYDGANLNAILGKVRPGDMGFDVMHMNLHKTFATPHGGGGPGSGPVAVSKRLLPYLPVPIVAKEAQAYRWLAEKECPQTIGRLSTFMGNAGILLRAYAYLRLLGKEGLYRVAEYATLNANYLMVALQKLGYQVAFHRRATHEFIITLAKEAKQYEMSAMDVAKRILDAGFYAPTTYFPLLIPECFLIEPTETESKQTLDAFVAAMQQIRQEMASEPEKIRSSPSRLACKRLDEVKAARELNLVWKPKSIDSSP